jgi:hypothetical protein
MPAGRHALRVFTAVDLLLGTFLLALGEVRSGVFLLFLAIVAFAAASVGDIARQRVGREAGARSARGFGAAADLGIAPSQIVACALLGTVCFVGGITALGFLVIEGARGWHLVDLLVATGGGLSLGSLCLYGAGYVFMRGRS